MQRKNKIILGLAVFLLVALIGGYFAASKLDLLPAGKVSYVNSISELENQDVEIAAETIGEVPLEEALTTLEKLDEKIEVEKKPEVAEVKELAPKKEPTKKEAPVEIKNSDNNVGKIIDKLTSWGYTKASDRKIDTIIVHSSYDALGDDPYSVSGIIAIYKQYQVSAHYLIARDGAIYRLVEDKNIAWHAGVSKMPDGRTNVNDFSIGVEMVNTLDGKYTPAQYEALNGLIAGLKKKYPIEEILGHDDIAPGRKTDPWGIEWDKVDR